MTTLVFDIVQFFLSLNHQLLPLILNKAGFYPNVLIFFFNYLVGKKTQYMWNNLLSSFFEVDISIEQDSALYLLLVFYIFEKHIKNLKISVSFLSFIDNSPLISQEKSFEKTISFLFYSYNIVSSILDQFGLVIEYEKTEVFHFSRS